MRTAVVILNWNTKEYLRAFLPELLGSLGKEDSLFVADSGSTDGSMEMMAAEFPQVQTIPLGKNFGFTGGYNRALEGIDAEYYVLINSDVLVSKGWLEPLAAWMESHPQCGICGPKLLGLIPASKAGEAAVSEPLPKYSSDETAASKAYRKTNSFEYAGAAGGFLDAWGFPFCRGRVLNRVCEDRGQYDFPARVLWCTGACLMVRSSVWKALGGLDDRFFAHMEEIDLCWRAQLAGWEVTVVPQSTVWHLGGGTLEPKSPWKLELNYRNNLLLLENNLAATYVAGGMPERRAAAKAARHIAIRRGIDNLTRIVYFFTGRREYAAAVRKAHAGYRQLRRRGQAAAHEAVPVGIARICIIPAAFSRRDGVFTYLDKKVFKI